MRTDEQRRVDSILVAAFIMLALSGTMAMYRLMAPDSAAEIVQFQTVRY